MLSFLDFFHGKCIHIIFAGLAEPVRDEEGEGQQGCCGVKHHVRCGSVPTVLEGALEVPSDGGEQALRVHARAASGRAGHGVRHVPQDRAEGAVFVLLCVICHM